MTGACTVPHTDAKRNSWTNAYLVDSAYDTGSRCVAWWRRFCCRRGRPLLLLTLPFVSLSLSLSLPLPLPLPLLPPLSLPLSLPLQLSLSSPSLSPSCLLTATQSLSPAGFQHRVRGKQPTGAAAVVSLPSLRPVRGPLPSPPRPALPLPLSLLPTNFPFSIDDRSQVLYDNRDKTILPLRLTGAGGMVVIEVDDDGRFHAPYATGEP